MTRLSSSPAYRSVLGLAVIAAVFAQAATDPAAPPSPPDSPPAAPAAVAASEPSSAPLPPEPSLPRAAPADADSAGPPDPRQVETVMTDRAHEEIQSLLRLGPTLTDRGDFQAATIAFHQVLRHPVATEAEIKPALLGLARMHRKQGALAKAVAIYERFIKDYPNDDRLPDALLDLGRTFRSLGIHKLALARFYSVLNSTLKISGGNFEHYQLLARTAQFEIAQTHFEARNFAEAVKFFTRLRLLDLAPVDQARAHFMSAYALRLQGDLEGAVTTLRSFIDQSPDDENIPEARSLLAITLRELKRPQEAYAATLDLLRTEKSRTTPDSKRWAYWQRRTGNQLANDFFENGDILNAHSIYTSLVELSPDLHWRIPLLYQIGLCQERLGSPDRAGGSYRSMLEALGATPAPEFQELANMASWRLDHLQWRERVDQQLATFFSTTTGQRVAPAPPESEAATANQ